MEPSHPHKKVLVELYVHEWPVYPLTCRKTTVYRVFHHVDGKRVPKNFTTLAKARADAKTLLKEPGVLSTEHDVVCNSYITYNQHIATPREPSTPQSPWQSDATMVAGGFNPRYRSQTTIRICPNRARCDRESHDRSRLPSPRTEITRSFAVAVNGRSATGNNVRSAAPPQARLARPSLRLSSSVCSAWLFLSAHG